MTGTRALPIAVPRPARRSLPLAPSARPIDRKWRPINVVWELTLRCDLACHHCSSRAARARPDELTTKEALRVVEELASLEVLEVTLIGGEAYLRDDWLEVIAAIRRAGMACTMVTGGRGITAERARAIQQAGVQSMSVSIDGTEDVHDALRGLRGSYKAAFAALEALTEAGVQVSANTQVARPNRRTLPALFDRLLATKVHAWQVQLTVAMGRVVDSPDLLLEPYQLIEVMPMLARLKARADEAGVVFWPGNNLGYFGPHEHAFRGTSVCGHRGSCGAGRSTMGIESNGNVKGCPSLPSAEYVGGNVRDHSLTDVWERSEPLRFTRIRGVEDLWGYCRTCYYASTCIGGCSWTAHSLLGRRGNNPFCHHRALDLLRAGKRERVVRIAEAEGQPFDMGLFALIVEDWPAAELARANDVASGNETLLLDSVQ